MPLTELQKLHGPFAFVGPRSWGIGERFWITQDSGDRIKQVRQSNDAEWLAAVIADKHTQKTVRKAAEVRLRRVEKALKNDLELRGEAEVQP